MISTKIIKTMRFYMDTKQLFKISLFLLVFSFISPMAQATSTINDVSFTNLPGNRIQIAIKLDSTPSAPASFTIENPSRIAFDFLNTTSSLKRKVLPIGLGTVKSVTTVSVKGRTRVVINLTKLITYKTNTKENSFFITINSNNNNTIDGDIPDTSNEPVEVIAGNNLSRFGENENIAEEEIRENFKGNRFLQDIDFRRGANGEGRVILKLSSNNIPANVREQNGSLLIELLDTGLPQRLKRRLDVLDFATPIKSIDTDSDGKNVQITINTSNRNYEQLAYQSKNIFTIELKPLEKEELERKIKDRFGFTGEKLSLNFQDIEIRAVLQLLADFTEQNLVVSDTVSGKLTLRLKNVPWDHALDIILKSKALGMRKNGNVLLIAPTEEIAAREKLELEAQQQVEELAPLKTEFMQVNFGKALTMSEMLKSEGGSILSNRGSVTLDERTNTLIVRDTEEILGQIRDLVKTLDKPVRQVLIEARVVIASKTFGKDLGVRWGVNAKATSGSTSGIVGGNTETVSDIATTSFNGTPTASRYAVNLAAASATSTLALAVANLGQGTLLELELSALQKEGNGEVVASPRIITANQKEAVIENGVEIPYIVVSNGDAKVNYKDALLSLRVTPQITPDDHIILDIQVNKDAVGQFITVGASSIPSIEKREIKTQVLVNNGETIVLGGVYEESDIRSTSVTPFFSDLPLIGALFKNNNVNKTKSELLVFVTPKIIKDLAGINY